MRPLVLFIPFSLWAMAAQCTQAQSPFSRCLDGTGNIFNATVVVPTESAPTINGMPLAAGSEIAVYSSDAQYPNLCVGVFVWQADQGFVVVWGDDDLTPERDGLVAGELLRYRVWDRATGFVYDSESIRVRYAQGDGRYSNDALMVLAGFTVMATATASEEMTEVPEEVKLYANYPNPFNDATTIAFDLPGETHVTIAVYDLLGKQVEKLIAETLPAGRHEVRWHVPDVPSGIYLCQMQAGGIILRQEFTVVK